MKKLLQRSGLEGSVIGTIEIKFNHRQEEKTVQVPVIHEERQKVFYYHVVTGRVGDNEFVSPEFQDKNEVWKFIEEIEKFVRQEMDAQATTPKPKPLHDQLYEKGFR